MVTLTLKDIISRLIFEHGLSGSGKGELQAAIQNQGRQHDVEVLALSSGDEFRARIEQIRAIDPLQRTPEEEALAGLLNKGIFVPTLDLVRPALTKKLTEFIYALADGKQATLVLDGFLRMGRYETVFEDEKRLVPSQVVQVAAALDSAIRLADIAGVNFEDLDDVLGGDEVDLWEVENESRLTQIAEEISRTATHLIVNIPEKDAEALMRFRALKEMRKVYNGIVGDGGRVFSDDLAHAISALRKTIHLESGNFTVVEGVASPLLETESDIKPAHSSELEGFTSEEGQAVDLTIKRICAEVAERFGIEQKVSTLVSQIVALAQKDLGLTIEAGPLRDDDIWFKYRDKRIVSFRDGTILPVLVSDLGLELTPSPDGRMEIPKPPENVLVLDNGPSLGFDYPALQRGAESVALRVLMRLEGSRLVFGERAF